MERNFRQDYGKKLLIASRNSAMRNRVLISGLGRGGSSGSRLPLRLLPFLVEPSVCRRVPGGVRHREMLCTRRDSIGTPHSNKTSPSQHCREKDTALRAAACCLWEPGTLFQEF